MLPNGSNNDTNAKPSTSVTTNLGKLICSRARALKKEAANNKNAHESSETSKSSSVEGKLKVAHSVKATLKSMRARKDKNSSSNDEPVCKKTRYSLTNHDIDQILAKKRRVHQNIVVSPIKSAEFVSLKTPDAEKMKKAEREAAEQAAKIISADTILLQILEWNVTWIKDQSKNPSKSPPIWKSELKKCQLSYNSLDEYLCTYRPLMLYEIWSQIMERFEVSKTESFVSSFITSYELCGEFLRVDCMTALNKSNTSSHPMEGDLIVIELPIEFPNGGSGDEKRKNLVTFSYVQTSTTDPISKVDFQSYSYKVPQDADTIIQSQLRLKFRPIKIATGKLLRMKPIFYLKPALRNSEALLSMRNSKLCPDILKPSIETLKLPLPSALPKNYGNYNESQLMAVIGTSEAVRTPWSVPKMILIQGPPGTGKTSTLNGMIKRMFEDWDSETNQLKILICAPSNGAIDEIARRLVPERSYFLNTRLKRSLKVVRMGQITSIHPDVKKISIDELVDGPADGGDEISIENKDKIAEAQKELAEKEAEAYDLRSKGEMEKARKYLAECQSLMRKLKFLRGETSSGFSETSRYSQRLETLRSADVILTTLNSCRQSLLEHAYLLDKTGPRFNVVIIDEAAQCSEPEILMPLVYSSISKMVLIGDPMQLPATVISKVAASHDYGRSLFERIFTYFGSYSPDSPVLMLDTQYRMLNEICAFPSHQFYNRRLKTSPTVNYHDFPLKPYIVLQLQTEGMDFSNPRNIHNQKEAEAVMKLYTLIDDLIKPNSSVGIITPYQGQKKLIQFMTNSRTWRSTPEVNTVDGFQGQEKDVIILSCVRSFNSAECNLGFLTSTQRLNVALTRAKKCLILCLSNIGQLDNEMWTCLIQDARMRNILYRYNHKNLLDIKRCILKGF